MSKPSSPAPDGPRPTLLTIALALLALASVLPLWSVEVLPFSDIPEQIAVIATLRHWSDSAFSGPYVFEFGKSQYVLYHLVGALLAIPFGTAERANLVLLSMVGIALPFSFRALLRALGRDERLAVFAVTVFWSRPLLMGFLPYIAAMPAVVYGLALAVRQWESPRSKRAVGLALLTIALFFLHVDPFVVFVLALALMRSVLFVRSLRDRRTLTAAIGDALRDSLWVLPALAVGATWSAFGSLRSSVNHGHLSYLPPDVLVRELPAWSHDIWRSHVDEACSIVVWLAFAVLLIQRPNGRRDGSKTALAAMPFLASAACYVLLPYNVGPAVMLNVRVAVFVVLFIVLFVGHLEGKRALVPLVAVAIASLVNFANTARELRRIEAEELGATSRLLDGIPAGARLLTLPFHVTSPRTHWAPWTFVGAYHRVRHGGVASFSFSEIEHWPVHYAPAAAPPQKGLFWTFNACSYRNAVDGEYYDYVLARGSVDPFRDAPPGPVFERVGGARDFVLYKKNLARTNPAWEVADGGPCESRRSLELQSEYGIDPERPAPRGEPGPARGP